MKTVQYELYRWSKKVRANKTEQLLPYDLGDLLIGELERAFSEPLDDLDMDEEQRQRILESF